MPTERFLHALSLALRANLLPGLFLWGVALGMLALYYYQPAAEPVFAYFAQLKASGGFAYSALATAICGALLPGLYLYLSGRSSARPWTDLSFMFVFWAWRGIEVDLLYRGVGLLFGDDASFATVAKKVAFDQFVFSAFWAAPGAVLVYSWKNLGYSWAAWRAQLGPELFRSQLPVNVVSNWLVWIPAVSVIYSLPPLLQIPMFNLVLCFWSLLLEVLNARLRPAVR